MPGNASDPFAFARAAVFVVTGTSIDDADSEGIERPDLADIRGGADVWDAVRRRYPLVRNFSEDEIASIRAVLDGMLRERIGDRGRGSEAP